MATDGYGVAVFAQSVLSGDQARYLRCACGLMLGAGVVLARMPQGFGLPCPLRVATGVPCPFCGMTTSVKRAFAFDPASAIAANPAGVALVMVAVAVLVLGPTRLPIPPTALVVTSMALMWAFQLNRFGFI